MLRSLQRDDDKGWTALTRCDVDSDTRWDHCCVCVCVCACVDGNQYLAEDETSGRLFALKKVRMARGRRPSAAATLLIPVHRRPQIRCPLGSESVREAMQEVSPGNIHSSCATL